ncbi:hypothetical protein C8J57DRAFT_1736311 [Mycena rebaudengoi]|nr:hypothetical protein C8J57DRAFT_1736311 [Mycena rebaudengoi]
MSSNQVQHPCILFPRPESKLKPQTTVSLKYILVLNVPSTYPYATLPGPVVARRRVRVPFLEFRGLGAPPADVGSPGDVYIDCTPVAPRLFCRFETQWTAWPGPSDIDLVAHPDFVDAKWERYLSCSPGLGVEWCAAVDDTEAVRGSRGRGGGRAVSRAGGAGAICVQDEAQKACAEYSDAEDDEDEGADDDYDDDDKPSEPEYSPPKSPAPPPPTPAKPQRDPKAMQRLARELASLTSQRAQLVQHKRALQQQLLLAARSPMDKLRDEYQNYAAHASLADMEVTARLAGAVFRLDEGVSFIHCSKGRLLHILFTFLVFSPLFDDGELTPRVKQRSAAWMGGTWQLKNNSSGSFGLLPPCPQIFNGHESELQDVVNILMQDSAHIAILGAGGMGKTSLATVALHNPQVEAKYSHRYFVPCHSSPTCTELAATIADHIGLEKGSTWQRRLHIILPMLPLPFWS